MDRNQRTSQLASDHNCDGDASKSFMKTVTRSKIGRKVNDSLTLARSKRERVYRTAGRTCRDQIGGTMPTIEEGEEEEKK